MTDSNDSSPAAGEQARHPFRLRCRAPLMAASVLLGLFSAFYPAIVAQEPGTGRKIVLDIPVQRSARPEASKEIVTLHVRGMMKSRSGAT